MIFSSISGLLFVVCVGLNAGYAPAAGVKMWKGALFGFAMWAVSVGVLWIGWQLSKSL